MSMWARGAVRGPCAGLAAMAIARLGASVTRVRASAILDLCSCQRSRIRYAHRSELSIEML